MKNYQKDTIPTTPQLVASCLGAFLRLVVKLVIDGGIIALIYLAIKWLVQNT